MKALKVIPIVIGLSSLSSMANTSLENTYLDLNQMNVESQSSKKIILNAKRNIKKIHQELISISYEEKIHKLKALGVEFKGHNYKLLPLKSLDENLIDEQMKLMVDLNNTIDKIKTQVFESRIIKIDRSNLFPFNALQKKLYKYNVDMGYFRTNGFKNYFDMFDFAKETTDIEKVFTKNDITYTLTKISDEFCENFMSKYITTEFIHENYRAYTVDPLLGWSSLKKVLKNAYKGCDESN